MKSERGACPLSLERHRVLLFVMLIAGTLSRGELVHRVLDRLGCVLDQPFISARTG